MKYIKASLIGLVLLSILSVVGIEVFYSYQVNQLNPRKVVTEEVFPDVSYDALWVASGELEQIGMAPRSAIGFVISIGKLLVSDGDIPNRSVFPVGTNVSSMVAREQLLKSGKRQKNWHLANIALSIWVSNNYTANEALNYLLTASYFGFNRYGLSEAAGFYFGKKVPELDVNEIVSLVAISKQPSRYNPYCNTERLVERADHLLEKLVMYNSSAYSNLQFVMPNFKHYGKVTCKNL